MRHAVVHADGSVEIMRCYPIAAIKEKGGDEFRVVRVDDDEATGIISLRVAKDGLTYTLKATDSDIHERGYVPCWRFVFPDPAKEIGEWPPEHRATVKDHHPIRLAVLPTDRTYRPAWESDGRGVAPNMDKARAIQREAMRQARAPQLVALDVEYQRADEDGDDGAKKAAVQKKQALRDVTDDPAIEAARTPEELKAVWPDVLGKGA